MLNIIEPSRFNAARIPVDTLKPEAEWAKVHWIVATRYFVTDWYKGDEAKAVDWLTERAQLFERYCLPSLQNSPYLRKWYIGIDERFAQYLPDSLNVLTERGIVSILQAATSPKFVDLLTEELKEYKENIGKDQKIILTRLDNDDALSTDFFPVCATAALRLKGKLDDKIVSFGHGISYNASSGTASTYIFSNNHFVSSFFNKNSDVSNNCLAFNHSKLFEQKNIEVLLTRHPMWMEVIHGGNLKNRHINANRLSDDVLNRFAPEPSYGGGTQESIAAWRTKFVDTIKSSNAMKPAHFADTYATVCARVQPQRIFEIGIHEGNSIKMWRHLLGQDAYIACMDLGAKACNAARPWASATYLGSQADGNLLRELGEASGPFDMIVDDGSHQNSHILFTLGQLMKYLRSGGAYVVEDMFTSYWPKYGGMFRGKDTFMEYFKAVSDGMFAHYSSASFKHFFKGRDIPQIPTDSVINQISDIALFGHGVAVFYKK